jgi:hypothetical protein
MDDTYFPEISRDDYESFRAIIHDLMPTYEGWLRYIARRVAHWSKTHNIVKVAVKPDDVLTYLRKSGNSADLNSLYVAAKFLGERHKEATPSERGRPT